MARYFADVHMAVFGGAKFDGAFFTFVELSCELTVRMSLSSCSNRLTAAIALDVVALTTL